MKIVLTLFILISLKLIASGQNNIKGFAFVDNNSNGIKDAGEESYEGLYISNGKDFVSTDEKGTFSIQKLDGRFVFAIKPTGYQFALDKDFQPRFYHKGNSETFGIPLYPSADEKKYSMVLMGDPQVYAQDQINYLGEVATDELRGTDYKFMVVLGDLVGNAIPILPKVKTILGLTEKPNYFAIGNHDRDRGKFEEPEKRDNDSWEASCGPDYYSFNWGEVHFLVLDNVLTVESRNDKGSDYIPGIHPLQEEFIKMIWQLFPPINLLWFVPIFRFLLVIKKPNKLR